MTVADFKIGMMQELQLQRAESEFGAPAQKFFSPSPGKAP
jgi:hypothetical protein